MTRGKNMFNIDWQSMIYRLPAIIIALTVHEFSHGLTAYILGDKTAKNDGRLSLNPLRHIDPIGFFCLLVFQFGWAKPVMISTRNLKDPKKDMAITAAAGPVSNFLLAFVVIMIYRPLDHYMGGTGGAVMGYILQFLVTLFIINISLGIFNLLPIPPLDGSKVFVVFLPDSLYFSFISFRYGFIALIILVYTGATTSILGPLMSAALRGYVYVVDKIYFFIR